VRIYLAEGLHRTLVGRRPPTVRGRCERRHLGSVTVIRPGPVADGRPAGFAIPRVAGWTFLGRSLDDYRVISPDIDRDAMRRAAAATVLALEHWPLLRTHVALADPSPTLAAALWDLAGVLLERKRVRDSWHRLAAVGRTVPADSPMRAEVAERTDRAAARVGRLDRDVTTRLTHLSRLADETESFVRRQRALAEAREALSAADYLLDTGDPALVPADPAADLTEHTSAVLAAYQELAP
jgi:hypothetical protein